MRGLEKLRPLALLLVRVGLGVIFMYNGYPKFWGRRLEHLDEMVHINHLPAYFAYIAGVLELGGGAMLIAGLFTRQLGLLLAGEMATIDGARAVSLEAEIGSIEIGKKADMIVIDYENAFMTPIHHPVSAIVYSALGSEVSTVMIDGRFVMRDGVVSGVNEAAVRRQAQISADDLARRSGSDRFKKRPWRSMTI